MFFHSFSQDQCIVLTTSGSDPDSGDSEKMFIEYADIINDGLQWEVQGAGGKTETVEGYIEIRDGNYLPLLSI